MKEENSLKPPFFSVIITTYNRKKLLERALSSLLNQTEKDWEVVLIDDGSEDGTSEMIPAYQKKIPFSYVYQENKGFIQAKNEGIRRSKGEYLTFLDSDDEYAANHLENRKEILQKYPDVELLHGGAKVIGNQYVPDNDRPGRQILVTDCAISGTFFIKRKRMLELGGFKGTPLSVDADFMKLVEREGLQVMKVDISTYIYHRDTESSVTLDMMRKTEKDSR